MRIVLFFIALVVSSFLQAQIFIPKFDVQGHRGARGLMPENTIPAFILALDSGVTTLEMDVVITADKQVLVSHEPYMSAAISLNPEDEPIRPREESKFNIYKMTYEQVKLWDVGSKMNEKFPQQKKINVSKPLLRDVIVAVENHIRNYSRYEVDYNIEIKSEDDSDDKFHPKPEEFSELLFALIDQYLPLDRVVIQSFDLRVLKYWHSKHPEVRLSLLVDNLNTIDENLKKLGFRPSVYSPEFKLLSKTEISYLHAMKIRCIPWTVNDIKDMEELKAWKVDGFITDYPDRARRLGYALRPQPVKK
ncbi:MAG: glycerophosphodiester phosphodiesterase [Cytophaga sp.]|nr:glycerophosphodiester phosphodiesterase [Cytophaga sp.]